MVRSKFDARLQYLVIAAAQYAAPALTVVFSLAVLVHVGGGSGGDGGGGGSVCSGAGIGGSASPTCSAATITSGLTDSEHGLGVCDAARRLLGLQSWEKAFAAATSAASAAVVAAAAETGGAGSGAVGLEGGSVGSPRDLPAGVLRSIPELPKAFWSGAAGFLAWWACLSWAVTYAMGVVFWRVYPEDVSAAERERSDTTTKGKNKVRGKAKAKGGSRGGGGVR